MDTVAVDVGTACVDLAKWDGRALQVEKLPTADPCVNLTKWLDILGPNTEFRFSFRSTNAQFGSAAVVHEILMMAERRGASRLDWVRSPHAERPSMTGARWFANRHRLGHVLVMDWGSSDATCGLVDPSEYCEVDFLRSWSCDANGPMKFGSTFSELETWNDARREAKPQVELVCCGGIGSALAAKIADRTGFSRALVPEYAGCLGTIGMIVSPTVFQADVKWEPGPLDAVRLRVGLCELMNQLGHQIALAGYDFDDVFCDQFVRWGQAGDKIEFSTKCGHAPNETHLREIAVRRLAERGQSTDKHQRLELRGAMARAVIDTRQWELPPPQMAKCVQTRALAEEAVREFAPTGNITERFDLPTGALVVGPAAIREPWHITVVPAGWRAETARAGGILLRKSDEP